MRRAAPSRSLIDVGARSRAGAHLRRDAGGEKSSSCCRGTNPGDERFRRGALDEVANGSRQHGLEHVLLGTGDREHQDSGRRDSLPKPARRLYAAQLGHLEIHQDDVGTGLCDRGDRLLAVAGSADHVESVRAEQRGECLPEEAIVVDDEDADVASVSGLAPFR